MLIYLVRHTPVGVPLGQCYGRTDVPLAPDWRDEIPDVRARLGGLDLNAADVVSSPAKRCRLLAEALGARPRLDPRLAEFDFGDWEGKQWESLPRAELDAWHGDLAAYQVPGGESLLQVAARVWDAFEATCVKADRDYVWVSHGGTIRALLTQLLDMPLHQVFRLQVDHGGVSCVQVGPHGARVLFINR